MSYIDNRTKTVQGLSVEVLNAIFTPTPDIRLRPWARCLAEVETMQGSDLVMSSFKTPEREQKFYFSRPYFSLTPSYFFSRQRFSNPPITSLKDLDRYKICALHGAAVSYTGLAASKIESGATNYLSLIRKIDRGHCDIVVDMEEVFQGFAHLGLVPFTSPDYQILPLPETERFPLHFAISKAHPQAKQILEQVDNGIVMLQKNGKLRQLHERFQNRR
jgi:polar amino acid transport system substrate-binding protein